MPHLASTRDCRSQCIVIAVDDAVQQQILLTVAAAHSLRAIVMLPEHRIDAAIVDASHSDANPLWIVDLARLHRETLLPAELMVLVRRVHPGAWLLLSHAARVAVDAWVQSWARNRGAIGVVPSLSPDCPKAVEACLKSAIEVLGVDWRRASVFSSFPALADATARPAAHARAHRMLSQLESRDLDLGSLATWAGAEFRVGDRVWRGTTYRSVFEGREAVTALARYLGTDRAAAVEVGELLRQSRLFRHVKNEHAFEDDELFYRFTPITEKLRRLSLAHVLSHATGRGGFELRDRLYLSRIYKRCLIGSEAVEWMQQHYDLTEDEALTAGQAMLDLGTLAHVTDEHEFKNEGLFYEWRGFARAMVPAE